MDLQNALVPSSQQMTRLLASPQPGPVVMVNMLRFRDRAVYADGRATDLSGLEAYMIYSAAMKDIVAGHGGRFLISVLVDHLMIGSGEVPWHRISMVEYPSRAEFAAVSRDPVMHAAAVHRQAGLEGQLLIASTLQAEHR